MARVAVGSIEALWRFPVKSMRGEPVDQAEFARTGLLGDRAYALIDVDTGKVVSAKSVRSFPDVLQCSATFVTSPRQGDELPAVLITLPNNDSVSSDSPDVDQVLSRCFARSVTLARSAPEDFIIDLNFPDVADLDPDDPRDAVVEQKLGSALFAELGVDSPVPVESFLDLYPVSMITTSSLARLSELQPQSRFDNRRFRMNVVVATEAAGFVENVWVGQDVALGETVRLRVDMPDPRGVMTTLAQGDLPKDNEILRTVAEHNSVPLGSLDAAPCAGVYAVVQAGGTVRRGDRVVITS